MRDICSLSGSNGTSTHNHLIRKRTLNHLAKLTSLAKWLSVRLQTTGLWVLVPLHSLNQPLVSRNFCRVRLKGYSQTHLDQSSINPPDLGIFKISHWKACDRVQFLLIYFPLIYNLHSTADAPLRFFQKFPGSYFSLNNSRWLLLSKHSLKLNLQ